jgi:choline dehydrogenase-like flavoprotein
MIVYANSLPENHHLNTDVCIVGGGTAGVTLAREFIGQKFSVCLLESGGLKPDKATQSLACGEIIGHPYFSIGTSYARYLGGSTNRWMIAIGDSDYGARMRPLDCIDFEKRDWIPYSGWPFEKTHLDPFYDRAQGICNILPSTFDINHWADSDGARRPIPLEGGVKTVIFKFGSRDPFLKTYLPEISKATNIHIYLYANAIELEGDRVSPVVNCLRAACLNGNKFRVTAKIFILSAGGIETPRLMLLSNKVQGAGMGNQHDLVGRFFMEHLHFLSGVLVPRGPEVFQQTALYNRVQKIQGVPIIGKFAIEDERIRKEKIVNHAIELVPRIIPYSSLGGVIFPSIRSEGVNSYKIIRSAIRQRTVPEDFKKHLMNVVVEVNDVASNAYRKLKKKSWELFNRRRVRAFRLASMSEQVPNPASRITLSEIRDRLNINCVKLDWRLDSIDIQSVNRVHAIMEEAFQRCGIGKLYIEFNETSPPERVTGGWHQMGTTRMHTDMKQGVVDSNCKVHGVNNLYVAGPSVFPTGGYANPVLTTIALAVRLSDHIKKHLA